MDKIWYYTRGDGQRYGPYTDEDLIKLIRQGILEGEDYIWTTDLDEWVQIKDTIYSIYLEEDTIEA
ncbi:MAG: DUF4339 domain-containing protein [Bulleidia sp.]|nr:DUF4339 domain-containing protein [Erysipelotrichaceae bacterium]MDY2781277.1 DUF4339 domain-containing protein [Bulleidia sp.]